MEASSSHEKKEIQNDYKVLEDDSNSMLLNLNDSGTWPNIISNKIIETLVEIRSVHVDNNCKFPVDEETGRKFNVFHFNKIMENGEKLKEIGLFIRSN